MTAETYTSKDGRVTVRDDERNPEHEWAVIIDTKEGDEHVARAIADGACPDCSGSGTAIFHAPGRHDWRYRPPVARQREEDDA